ncbi:hypothetical protein BG015_001958 [Linnemannia schmuckeri]|uniref:Uncharacterized protein n=1 Tax=Linnemannia schmuckeri TaxID=64567 RepID=A0A9P5RRK4_9FUNG|nr:hypothetical protein BG015_001958 [Linnemannia schmuckeri]
MVRLTFLDISALTISSCLTLTAFAYESEYRIYPIKFLVERYTSVIDHQLATLPTADKAHAETPSHRAIASFSGRDGAIDKAIFHKNCHDKPPRRSFDELCESVKSIACFAPWDHRDGVFNMVHDAVVDVMRETYGRENAMVRRAMFASVKAACPGQCKDWEVPFQRLMLGWEQKEHCNVYGTRSPNCAKGRLAY